MVKLQMYYLLQVTQSYKECLDNHETRFATYPLTSLELSLERTVVWDWEGFRRRLEYLIYIIKFSSVWQIYIVIRQLFKPFLEQMIDLIFNPNLPAHCYLIGKHVLQDSIADVTAVSFSIVFIVFSGLQCYTLDKYPCQVFYFMLLDESDIEQYTNLYKEVEALDEDSNEKSAPRSFPKNDFFLDFIMSYRNRKIINENKQIRLRPHRTKVTHQRYVNVMTNWNIFWLIFTSTASCLIAISIIAHVIQDRTYISMYPGCDPDMELLYSTKPGDYFSVTASVHRSFTVLGITIENLITYYSIAIVCFFGALYSVLICMDLVLYWKHIDAATHKLTRYSIIKFNIHSESDSPSISHHSQPYLSLNNSMGKINELLYKNMLSSQNVYRNSKQNYQCVHSKSDMHISELQRQIHDFFALVRQLDVRMTNVAALILGAWLLVFPMQTYNLKTVYGLRHNFVPYAYQTMLLLMTSSVSWLICLPHRKCIKTYTTLCTLVAHDQSMFKRGFVPILNYYAEGRTCFNLFRQFPFKLTTLLTILGWSISVYLVLENLVRLTH